MKMLEFVRILGWKINTDTSARLPTNCCRRKSGQSLTRYVKA
jgi:hypothetical protein